MANDRKNMKQDQKIKHPEQKPQEQQSGARGDQGNRDQVRQARQAYPNKGTSSSEHEGSQQGVGNDGLIENADEVERGNDLDDVSGEITERFARHSKTDHDKDRR